MFTGIISAIGDIASLEERGGDVRLTIRSGNLNLADVQLGDSIACNGACLTAVELTGEGFVADVSVETLNLTTIGNWQTGSRINMEKAMQATDRFGGHIVSGHVDGIGEVVALEEDARSWRFRLRAPREIAKYIAHKGSITVDGTSLTVNIVEGAEFELNIVPHTMQHTVMGDYKVGTKVNLEVDLVARYLERLLLGDKAADQ
ncbi:MAG: riboflavin synthase [Porticoccaceae bacterium]|jgi:riboflavin synthase|nr:riboflavin synthase [Porticoccaceae bacterium]